MIKVFLIIAVIIQTVATVYALQLVRATKYNAVWILFIIGFSLLLGLVGLWRQFHRKKDPDE